MDELILRLESGYYLQWEAVVRMEQGLGLRQAHEEALEDLWSFGDEEDEVVSTGWPRLVETLKKHARDLSLPEGATSPIDIFPAGLQHGLWLQTCFDALDGLGQDERLTLEDEAQQERVDWFIRSLKAHKDSVSHFGVTLVGLVERTVMPPKDKQILTRMMMDRLALPSSHVPLAEMF